MAVALSIIVVLAVGVSMIFFWRQAMRRRSHPNTRQPDMQAAWQSWLNRMAASREPQNSDSGLLDGLKEEMRDSVYKSLLEFETGLATVAEPMLAVRRELMDSVDRRQLNSEILNLPHEMRADLRRQHPDIMQDDEAAQIYILANEVRIEVLREYAGLRYADRTDGDWFDVYQKASRLRQRSTRNYIERTLGGTQTAVDEARFHTMTLMDGEIRTRLLKVPAGTRFPGFGQPAHRRSEPV